MKLPLKVIHKYVTLAKSTKGKLSLAKGFHTLRILSWNECTVQSEQSIMEMLTDLHHQVDAITTLHLLKINEVLDFYL